MKSWGFVGSNPIAINYKPCLNPISVQWTYLFFCWLHPMHISFQIHHLLVTSLKIQGKKTHLFSAEANVKKKKHETRHFSVLPSCFFLAVAEGGSVAGGRLWLEHSVEAICTGSRLGGVVSQGKSSGCYTSGWYNGDVPFLAETSVWHIPRSQSSVQP